MAQATVNMITICDSCNSPCGSFDCCKKCKLAWFCKHHEEHCFGKMKLLHEKKCRGNHNNVTNRQPLRFKVNDKVIFLADPVDKDVSMEPQYVESKIVEVWPERDRLAIYSILRKDTNKVIKIDYDSTDFLRVCDFDVTDPKKWIAFHLKYGDQVISCENIMKANPTLFLDKAYWKGYLLHSTAMYGNMWGTRYCSEDMHIEPWMIDSKGRNILHLGILNKRLMYCEFLSPLDESSIYNQPQMLTHADDDGRNAVHHFVLTGLFSLYEKTFHAWFVNNTRFRNVFEQQDNKGRTALEYAIAFKKPDFIRLLASHTIDAKFAYFTHDRMLDSNSTEHLLQLMKQRMTIAGMTIENITLSPAQTMELKRFMGYAVNSNGFPIFDWLMTDWQLHIRLGHTDASAFYRECLLITIRGPDKLRAEMELFKQPAKMRGFDQAVVLSALRDEFHSLVRQWSGKESFMMYLLKFTSSHDPEKTNETTYRLRVTNEVLLQLPGGYGTELFHLYVSHQLFGNRVIPAHHVERVEYFVSKLPGLKEFWRWHPDPRTILKWFVIFYAKKMNDKVCFTPELFDYACDLPWYADAEGYPFNSSLTVRTFLVFMCATLDADCEFNDLVPFIGGELPLLSVMIKKANLLDIAILHGSYGIVRECIVRLRDVLKKTAPKDNERYIQQAVDGGHHAIAYEMVKHFGTNKTFTVNPALLRKYYKLKSSSVVVKIIASAVRAIQRLARYGLARRKLWPQIAEFRRFKAMWYPMVLELRKIKSGAVPTISWSTIKKQYDMVADDTDSAAIISLFEKVVTVSDDIQFPVESVFRGPSVSNLVSNGTEAELTVEDDTPFESQAPLENIELSSAAIKWFYGADTVMRELFSKRLIQLADGQRSYALSKRLQHCDRLPIYETKLDSGARILWTKVVRDEKESIMVWFVSHHDFISKYARRIEESCSRLSRQLILTTDNSATESAVLLGETDILLDPTGNAPLKLYSTNKTDLSAVSIVTKWTPPLLLSVKQRSVNEESGSVLLLGRSGTGKTICLCDRIIRDQRKGINPFKQLFVCRSARLCEFVRNYQEQYCDVDSLQNIEFMTLSTFTERMSAFIASDCGVSDRQFAASDRVDYHRFVSVFYPLVQQKCSVMPSIAWLHIRSFIKGSVEAVIQKAPLALGQYTDLNVFGADRCRLSVVARKEVYALYLRYQGVLKTQGLWDDADYTLDLLIRSKLEPLSTQYDKVYVDEVQDNTQAEIVLYFLVAGMSTNSLFLAGDPAQSVVEGVDFRFEDVRSIVYKLSGGKHSINRPMKLFVNYRSHSGVLDCAAAILSKMFAMFPAAANVLPKDVGLFKGPRPACCQVDGMEGLAKLLVKNERLVVLCVDAHVDQVTLCLRAGNIKNIVLGIRAAKGLEFQDVVLLDFFAHIPVEDHAVWKQLLTSDQAVESTAHPHVELQLKLLYTAVTRSCNRLLFVETEKTQLSSVMFRWLVGGAIAETYNVSNQYAVFMTSDEWRVQGIEFALSAEGDNTAQYLNNAIQCFTNQKERDNELSERANVQLSLFNYKQMMSIRTTELTNNEEMTVKNFLLKGLQCGFVGEVKIVLKLIQNKVEQIERFEKFVVFLL